MNDNEKPQVIQEDDIQEDDIQEDDIQEDEPVDQGWFNIVGISMIIFFIMPFIIMFLLYKYKHYYESHPYIYILVVLFNIMYLLFIMVVLTFMGMFSDARLR
jgi:hypothetical protein